MSKITKLILKVLCVLSIILVICVYTRTNNIKDIDISILITYFTFMFGFVFNAYISLNNTTKAENLKINLMFHPVKKSYKKVIRFNVIGLIITLMGLIINFEIIKLLSIIFLIISLYQFIILVNDTFEIFSYQN